MAFELEFDETFNGQQLNLDRWLPHYLPHWSSRERSAARYRLEEGRLHLRIEHDQEPWCPELDGEIRVSSLQTAELSGPVGSAIGVHRFHPRAVVREAQPETRLYTPRYGRIEIRAAASRDPTAMVSLWMIGVEEEPEHSAEICVFEIFGRDVDADVAAVGMGVRRFSDPRILDDFDRPEIPIDVTDFHDYAATWLPDRVTFSIDEEHVRSVEQSPDYPMQLMLGVYEFPEPGSDRSASAYPKTFVVDSVRGFRLAR